MPMLTLNAETIWTNLIYHDGERTVSCSEGKTIMVCLSEFSYYFALRHLIVYVLKETYNSIPL
jgi:hypothetical protein